MNTNSDNILANVEHLIEAAIALVIAREPAAANFEVADGVLRLRADRASQVPLGNLPLNEGSGEVSLFGFTFRPANSGVDATSLQRAALATSVLDSLRGARPGGASNRGDQNADVAAIQAIRGALGKLDSAAPEGLNQVLYKRAAPGAMTEAAVTQAANTITARWANVNRREFELTPRSGTAAIPPIKR